MPRVKIKTPNSKDPRRTNNLLEILTQNDIYITRLDPLTDGFVIITGTDDERDKIFKQKTQKELNEAGFLTITPPELRASRSVIIPRTANHIYKNDEEEIKEEINNNNEWAKNNIDNIFKFPNSKTIKITFKETCFAKKALSDGIKLFHMRIPHNDIKQEEFYNINTCFRCYVMEDHYTNQCKKPADYKVCSECSSTSHTWRDCLSSNKRCLNCQGEHRTLAAKCPLRKEIIKKNKKENSKMNTATYSQITGQNMQAPKSQQTNTSTINIPQMSESFSKIFTCMMHAHLLNMAEPGCYNEVLNSMLTKNNLPKVIAPNNPPSAKIINNLSETNVTAQTSIPSDTHTTTTPAKSLQTNPTSSISEKSATTGPEEHLPRTSTQQKTHRGRSRSKRRSNTEEKTKSTDIGLTIYVPESIGPPQSDITGIDLHGLISNRTYTTKIESQDIDYFKVLDAIKSEKIEFSNCFKIIEDSLFKKLRPGREMARSPPERYEKIRKNSI